MAKVVCIAPFGNFKPGDEVEIPDGAKFDTSYFQVAPTPVTPPAPAPQPVPAPGPAPAPSSKVAAK